MKKHRITTLIAALMLTVLAIGLLAVSQASAAPAGGDNPGGQADSIFLSLDGDNNKPPSSGNPSDPPGPGTGQESPGTGIGGKK